MCDHIIFNYMNNIGLYNQPLTSFIFYDSQENEAVNYNLLDRLDKDELTELRKYFFEKKVDEKIKEPKGSAHPRFLGFKLTKNEFVDAVDKVIGKQQ